MTSCQSSSNDRISALIAHNAVSSHRVPWEAAHCATAARWVKRAHGRLVAGVQAAFQRRLGLTGADYESVLRLIRSRLELSLGTYLGH